MNGLDFQIMILAGILGGVGVLAVSAVYESLRHERPGKRVLIGLTAIVCALALFLFAVKSPAMSGDQPFGHAHVILGTAISLVGWALAFGAWMIAGGLVQGIKRWRYYRRQRR